MRLFLSFAFSFLLLTHCHHTKQSDLNTLVIGIESYPSELDPRLATEATSVKINHLIYNGLFKIDKNLQVVPDLVESYQFEDLELRIKLKKNVFFHHEKELTSDDVIQTYKTIINPDFRSPYASSFQEIKSIKKINSHEILIKLKRPYAPLLTSLTMPILPSNSDTDKKYFKAIGTGPYRHFKSLEGQKIVLKKNKNFFGKKAKTETLIFRTVYEDTLRTLELIKGRLDIVQNALPYPLLPAIEKETQKSGSLKIMKEDGINFSYLGFNLKDKFLGNKKVRQAIAHAIKRDEVIEYKLKNLAEKATSLLSPKHWAFENILLPYDYNPKKAKKLLDEAGFPDPDKEGPLSRFKLVYKTSTKRDRVEMALLIANYLKQIGIDVEVKSYEWGTFFRDIRSSNFQLYSLTWVGLTEPDIYYFAFSSDMLPPHGANRGYYINPDLDPLLEQARLELSTQKRKDLYQKIQRIIFEDLPYVPLWYEKNWVVTQKNVKGFELRPDAGFQSLVKTWKEKK